MRTHAAGALICFFQLSDCCLCGCAAVSVIEGRELAVDGRLDRVARLRGAQEDLRWWRVVTVTPLNCGVVRCAPQCKAGAGRGITRAVSICLA